MKHIYILSFFLLLTISCEDNMSSNSATKLATQQSIKSYVDTQVATIPVGISAQDNNKIHDVSLHMSSPTSDEFYEIERWNNTLDSKSVSYSYDWDTSLENDGNYIIKVVVNDHDGLTQTEQYLLILVEYLTCY